MTYDLQPKTKPVRARTLRRGDVILESYEHPAKITRVSISQGHVYLKALYVWQRNVESDWPLGPFHPDTMIEKVR